MPGRALRTALPLIALAALASACPPSQPPYTFPAGRDHASAAVAEVDRFSDAFATIHRRSRDPSLPPPGAPIDIELCCAVRALGPRGERIVYYDFDVNPRATAPMYVFGAIDADASADSFVRRDELHPMVTSRPGERGYNDLHHLVYVGVPADYVDGSIATEADLIAALDARAIRVVRTSRVINAPLVPEGSTAPMRWDPSLPRSTRTAWYEGQRVGYFLIEPEGTNQGDGVQVGTSPGFVFLDETGRHRRDPDGSTHTVFATLPGDAEYSALWDIFLAAPALFDSVGPDVTESLRLVASTMGLRPANMLVNCPVVARVVAP